MLVNLKILLIFLSLFRISVNGYRILGVFATKYKSHWIIGTSVMKELAAAGNDVTIISPWELKLPNIRNILIQGYPLDENFNMFDFTDVPIFMNFVLMPEFLQVYVNHTLSQANVQEIMSEKFDAVIIEVFQMEAFYGFGQHFSCPVIGLTTFGTSLWTDKLTGFPCPKSYVPNTFLSQTDKMTFWQRLDNVLTFLIEEIFLRFLHYPKQRALYEKYFKTASKTFDEQLKSVSLVFNNNHFASSIVKPQMPNMIDIGGIHIEKAKPLPNDIKEFLDDAPDGVILFSMGSIIRAVEWPAEKREAFVKAFGKLKQKVLWKYENETLPGKPDNVKIGSWIPQRDILAHPNVKLFITHGGLLGTTEALVESVPVLGIPIFGDQKMNINLASSKGIATVLNYKDITEESVERALDLALNNQTIRLKAKEVSLQYTDRPLTPKQTVVYWTEYVIKHKGAPHLRAASLDLDFIQLNLIDVYATIVALTFIVLSIFIYVLKLTLRKFFFPNKNSVKAKTK